MADIINTIGVGQDYETIELWWANAVLDDGNRYIGEYVDSGTISVATLAAKANSGGAELRAASGVAYNFDNPAAAHIKITASSGFALYNRTTSKFITRGFEIESTSVSPSNPDNPDNPIGVDIFADQDAEFYECKIVGGESAIRGRSSNTALYHFENCHITGSTKSGLWSNGDGFTTKHCVIEGCNTTNSTFHGGITEKANNTHDSTVCYGNGVKDYEGTSATLLSCASGDATAHGSGAVTGVTTADFTDTVNDIWTSKTGGLLDGTGTGGTNIGLQLTVANVIAIINPAEFTFIGRTVATNKADIIINGTYSGAVVPTAIEASFNGGAFATIDAAPSGGTYSGTLAAQDVGNGDLVVRFVNDVSVTSTQPNIAIGAKFLFWGQSNFSGRATNAQTYTGAAGFFHKYTVTNDAWQIGGDPFDTATSSGSLFPILANLLVADKSIPVGFIGVAQGSTALSQWQTGGTFNNRMLDYLTNSGGNDVEGVCSWIGETDADTGTIEATFKTQYNAVIDQLATLTGKGSVICGIAQANGTNVNQWMQDIVSTNSNALEYVDMSAVFTGVHYEADVDTANVASALFNGIDAAFFSSILNLSITGMTDGSFTTVLDDENGNRLFRGSITYTSETGSQSLPIVSGSRIKGYVDDGLDPSSNGAYIEGVTV